MGGKLMKGSLLGAVILFVWMMISWMALPWHCSSFQSFTNEEVVSQVLLENASHNGVYMLPNMCQGENSEKTMEAMKKGPVFFGSVQRQGFDGMSARPYIVSFVIYLVGAFFATYLLLNARPMIYGQRVFFITAFGIAVGVLASFPAWNWWGFPIEYVGVEFLDSVIGWFLVGLALAALIRTPVNTTKI